MRYLGLNIAENFPFLSNAFRGNLLSRYMAKCGSDFLVARHVHFDHIAGLTCGDRVSMNGHTWINAVGGVSIGDDVLLGPYVVIHSANHVVPGKDKKIRSAGHQTDPVTIGHDVWIGAHAIILPGVSIGHGAVIGAGSVVTKNIAPFSVVAGNPAKEVNKRV